MEKYLKIIVLILISISCTTQIKLKNDLKEIEKINTTIKEYQVEILDKCLKRDVSMCNESISGNMDQYTVSYLLEKSDTIISIVYSCREYNGKKIYRDCTVAKQYCERGLMHEISLFNKDTLYHFTSKSEEAARFFVDYKFKVGKYYYMFMCNNGLLSEGQRIYFLQHIDSLIKVRGDTLPELPSVDKISLQKYKENGEMIKVFEANPFL